MPKLFKVVDTPPTCYVKEAVYWLALGRVPEFLHGDGGGIDQRMGDLARQSAETFDFDYAFSEREFRWFGVRIDYPRYIEARSFETEEEIDSYVADWEARLERMGSSDEREDSANDRREFWNKIIRDAEESRWALQMERVFEPAVDRARAGVFEALASGKLKAQGWLANASLDEDELERGDFVDIEPSLWTFRGFGWPASRLCATGRKYEAIQVKTDDIFELFPRPSLESAVVLTFDCFPGGAAIALEPAEISTEAKREVAPRGRGRPPATGLVKDAVRNYLANKYKRQPLPKKEALVAEGIEVAEMLFGRKFSRPAIQWWLNGFLPERSEDRMPKILPKIP